MRRFLPCLTLLVCVAIGCGKLTSPTQPSDTPDPTPVTPEPNQPTPKPPPTPPLPTPPEPEKRSIQKETEALKPFGAAFQSEDGIEQSIAPQHLTGGRISPDLLAALKKTTTLRGLNFQFARDFSDAGLADIKDFTKLRKLFLRGTKVTDAGMAHVQGMTELEEVMLSNTKVTDKGLANLKDMAQLREIDLGEQFGKQDVTDAGFAQLKLRKLTRVQISNTKIADAGVALLKDSNRVRIFWAENCAITDAGLEHLKPLPKLMWVKLNSTQVTDAGLAHLEGLTGLSALEVEGTRVTKEGAEKLQAKLLKCTIKGTGFELMPK